MPKPNDPPSSESEADFDPRYMAGRLIAEDLYDSGISPDRFTFYGNEYQWASTMARDLLEEQGGNLERRQSNRSDHDNKGTGLVRRSTIKKLTEYVLPGRSADPLMPYTGTIAQQVLLLPKKQQEHVEDAVDRINYDKDRGKYPDNFGGFDTWRQVHSNGLSSDAVDWIKYSKAREEPFSKFKTFQDWRQEHNKGRSTVAEQVSTLSEKHRKAVAKEAASLIEHTAGLPEAFSYNGLRNSGLLAFPTLKEAQDMISRVSVAYRGEDEERDISYTLGVPGPYPRNHPPANQQRVRFPKEATAQLPDGTKTTETVKLEISEAANLESPITAPSRMNKNLEYLPRESAAARANPLSTPSPKPLRS